MSAEECLAKIRDVLNKTEELEKYENEKTPPISENEEEESNYLWVTKYYLLNGNSILLEMMNFKYD